MKIKKDELCRNCQRIPDGNGRIIGELLNGAERNNQLQAMCEGE